MNRKKRCACLRISLVSLSQNQIIFLVVQPLRGTAEGVGVSENGFLRLVHQRFSTGAVHEGDLAGTRPYLDVRRKPFTVLMFRGITKRLVYLIAHHYVYFGTMRKKSTENYGTVMELTCATDG